VAKATYLRPDEVIEMLRIWLIAMLAAAVLGVARGHDVLHRTGLIGYCTTTTTPPRTKGTWRACRKGVLDGRSDPASQSCRPRAQTGRVESWSCPARIEARAVR
jgi:hypothetical protein